MHSYKKFTCFLGSLLLMMISFSVLAKGTLTVHVTGLKNNNGSVRIALFNSEHAYSTAGNTGAGAYDKAVLPIKNGKAVWQVHLPKGDYAIKLFHDVDNSGVLKTNLFGKPKEGYGFSNNPSSGGPANYNQAKFSMSNKNLTMSIVIRH